jgi:hypothetical protein
MKAPARFAPKNPAAVVVEVRSSPAVQVKALRLAALRVAAALAQILCWPPLLAMPPVRMAVSQAD